MVRMNGFIVIDRNIEDWRWWGCPHATALWLHLLVKANWKDGYFMGHEVHRGETVTSYRHLSEETGMSEATVRRWLMQLKKDGAIQIKSSSKFSIIRIVNYEKYQALENEVNNGKKTGNTKKGQVRGVQEGQVYMPVLRKESPGRDSGSGSSGSSGEGRSE